MDCISLHRPNRSRFYFNIIYLAIIICPCSRLNTLLVVLVCIAVVCQNLFCRCVVYFFIIHLYLVLLSVLIKKSHLVVHFKRMPIGHGVFVIQNILNWIFELGRELWRQDAFQFIISPITPALTPIHTGVLSQYRKFDFFFWGALPLHTLLPLPLPPRKFYLEAESWSLSISKKSARKSLSGC